MLEISIHKFSKANIKEAAVIASEGFSAMKDLKSAKKWILGNFKNYPRMQYFAAKRNKKTLGYILWAEKAGFRKEAVFELEQIAVKKEFRGQGIGSQLILKSLENIKDYLKKRGSIFKIIEVTTRRDNDAQYLYKKTLGAKVECVIKDFLRGDEVIMIARKLK